MLRIGTEAENSDKRRTSILSKIAYLLYIFNLIKLINLI